MASDATHTAEIWHVSQAIAMDRKTEAERMNTAILPKMLRSLTVSLVLVCAFDARAAAQDPEQPPADHQHDASTPGAAWSWSADANVFYGYNHQQRRKTFTQFSAWESQNWFMLTGGRPLGGGHLMLHTMVSLEPFTMDPLGSPQLYQTGESYNLTPLVNYQHPHDLVMGLGATYRIERPRIAYIFGAHLVGEPALGPTAFMHRESARDNPQVPLSHHAIDSTHITPGVLTAGVEIGGFTVEGLKCDVSKPADVQAVVDRTIAAFGKVDILVNNAGVTWAAEPEDMALDKWQKVVDINLTGAFLFSQAAGRDMLKRQWGRIINVASISGLHASVAGPHLAPYAATKAGLMGLTRELAASWGRKGIRVNAIAPGFFHSRLADGAIELAEAAIKASSPIPRVGEAGELKGVAVFLASSASSYITGQIIAVDGGATIV